jgi:hypothetical protein
MARKLGLGCGVICTCVLLAGCQSGAASRTAGANQNRAPSGAFAKQGSTPPPNFPNNPQSGLPNGSGFPSNGLPTSNVSNNAFSPSAGNPFPMNPGTPVNPAFNPQGVTPIGATNNPPGLPPQGPQGFGQPVNRNVQITTPPGTPSFPAPPSQPGISQIPPPP